MDEVTSLAPLHGCKKNSKYATIAAVVGISTHSKNQFLDSSSNSGFMESIMQVFRPDTNNNNNNKNVIRPLESSIRLVGIGRAALSDFHSRLPSNYYQAQDDQNDGYMVLPQSSSVQDDDEDEDYDHHHHHTTPILMAQFRLLSDIGVRSPEFVKTFGRSKNASPVHALAEMNRLSNRITSLHEDRKRLVRGLKAAKARLAVASATSTDILEDHDGLGQLSSGFQEDTTTTLSYNNELSPQEQIQQDIDALMDEFPVHTADLMSPTRPTTNSLAQLLELEHYGMGISSASFAAIPGLTTSLTEKLQPYYSPEAMDSEEHYYSIFSFMGVQSLSKFVTAADLDWALKCTNTIERMQWVYEWMWSHKKLLQEASEEVSLQLMECGEECTDLW